MKLHKIIKARIGRRRQRVPRMHDTRKCQEGRSVYLCRRIHGMRQWWVAKGHLLLNSINELDCPCSPTFSSVDQFGNCDAAAWIFLEVGHSCEFLNKSHEIFRISVYSFWGVCVDDHRLAMLSCCGGGNGWRRCFFFVNLWESLLYKINAWIWSIWTSEIINVS